MSMRQISSREQVENPLSSCVSGGGRATTGDETELESEIHQVGVFISNPDETDQRLVAQRQAGDGGTNLIRWETGSPPETGSRN